MKDKKTKLQIPVPRKVSEEIGYFAAKWERTQSEMAAIILEVAIEEQKTIGPLLVKRIFQPILSWARPSKRGKTTKDISETVRLQVVVDEEIAEKLKAMGEEIKLSGVKMAGVLIDCALEDNSWCMEFIGTYLTNYVSRQARENRAAAADRRGVA